MVRARGEKRAKRTSKAAAGQIIDLVVSKTCCLLALTASTRVCLPAEAVVLLTTM